MPLPTGFVVKNGSKILSRLASGIRGRYRNVYHDVVAIQDALDSYFAPFRIHSVHTVVDQVKEHLLHFPRGIHVRWQVGLKIRGNTDVAETGPLLCSVSAATSSISSLSPVLWRTGSVFLAKLRSLWVISLQRPPWVLFCWRTVKAHSLSFPHPARRPPERPVSSRLPASLCREGCFIS